VNFQGAKKIAILDLADFAHGGHSISDISARHPSDLSPQAFR
jgi:hypothetical protein